MMREELRVVRIERDALLERLDKGWPHPAIVARWFHQAYEREMNVTTGRWIKWEQVPTHNRDVMTSAAQEMMHKLKDHFATTPPVPR